ncbi:MFS transporter [Streptomyces mayonensis]|uniref:MFS transporter n=1 Tax=Streptomyces mayonensis TaxID=2750816 RepID=UPI001C1E7357|nr:MFS transporter [Streptomyces sp. A108]MBU6529643.1 MFS transporter [Streptomyces sp. A108]
MIEWYDWFVYSTFSVYFASAFFPEGDATSQLLHTAGIFAVGFFMRPVGGWLLGRLGDRKGRKTALNVTVLLMSLSALLIAAAPTHGQIGYWGAVILLLARMLQGLSVGGEYAASATYLSEAAPDHRRGFFCSFQMVSMKVGQLIGLSLQIVLQRTMSDETLSSWGWRIPFILGALGAAAVFYLRRSLVETESFEQAVEETGREKERGTLRGLWEYRRTVALVVGFSMGGTLADYTYSTYMTKYLSNSAGLSRTEASLVSFVAILVFIGVQPLAGALSDRIGRRPLLITFGVGAMLFTVPLMTALGHVSTMSGALLLMIAGLLIISGYTSISALVKAELFPARIRSLGVALPYALANALFGGTAEYVALWFKNAGMESGFFWYVTGCAAISLVVYLTIRETKGVSFSKAEDPGSRTAEVAA